MDNRGSFKRNVIGSLITVIVIVVLVMMAPANAFNVSLGRPTNAKPFQGQIINFPADIEIKTNEKVPISQLSIVMGKQGICTFNVDGTPVSGCNGLTILPLSTSIPYLYGQNVFEYKGKQFDYGYGYGYAPTDGFIKYKVIMNTSKFKTGEMDVSMRARVGQNTFKSSEMKIVIKGKGGFDGFSNRISIETGFEDRLSNWLRWTKVCTIDDEEVGKLGGKYHYQLEEFIVGDKTYNVVVFTGKDITKQVVEKVLGHKLQNQCVVVRGSKVTAMLTSEAPV